MGFFAGFELFSLGFTDLRKVGRDFTGFCRVLLGFTGFY